MPSLLLVATATFHAGSDRPCLASHLLGALLFLEETFVATIRPLRFPPLTRFQKQYLNLRTLYPLDGTAYVGTPSSLFPPDIDSSRECKKEGLTTKGDKQRLSLPLCLVPPPPPLGRTATQETKARLEHRMRKLRPLRDLVFELFLSDDHQKRGLFAQFDAEKQRLKEGNGGSRYPSGAGNGGEVGGGGPGDSGPGEGGAGDGSAGGGEDRFNDLFGVMHRLGIIAEEITAIDDAPEDSTEAAEDDDGAAERGESGGGGGGGGTATADMSSVLAWAFWRTSDGGATIKGRPRGPSRTGSMRFSRRMRGFYRDPGQQGEDDWGTLTGSAPNLAPRILPPEWTSGNIGNADPPSSQVTPAAGAAAASAGGGGLFSAASQLSTSNHSGGGGMSESIRSGGGGGGGISESSRGATSRRRELSDSTHHGGGGRSFSMSSDRDNSVRGHRRDNSNDTASLDGAGLSASEGAAATAAASAMLSSRSIGLRRPRAGRGAGPSWSSRSVLSIHREGLAGEGKAAEADGGMGEPSSRAGGGGGGGGTGSAWGGDAPRLQLSDHGVREGSRVVCFCLISRRCHCCCWWWRRRR